MNTTRNLRLAGRCVGWVMERCLRHSSCLRDRGLAGKELQQVLTALEGRGGEGARGAVRDA